MALSARVFGVSSWSILVPEALEGVAAVGVLYLAVRRWFSAGSALLAGAVLALTPVAALMFRFNNPDAALVLLLVVGAYAMIRALERGSTWWLVFAFSMVGFGFLAKMLQALLVLPAFGLVYLIAAPVSMWKRVWQLTAACGALLVSAGWWIAIVELWPASSRPYIGGSQHNSVLELIFGYNGFGRLTGNETGSVGGGGGQTGQWGPTGITRMFGAEFGTQISWLLPAALILLVAGIVWRGTRPRTDRVRAAFVLWGGWLLVTGLTFSLGKGIIHQYYAIALAPAIGALVGMGAGMLWKRRHDVAARSVLAVAVAVTAIWTFVLLDRTPDWNPWLRGPLLLAGIVVAGRAARRAPAPRTRAARARARGRRRDPRRARRVHAHDGEHAAHRRDPHRRTGRREQHGLRRPRRLRAGGQFPGVRRRRRPGSPAASPAALRRRGRRRRRYRRCGAGRWAAQRQHPRAARSPRCSSRTPTRTRGWRPRSAPTRPPATSSPPTTR